MGIGERSDRVIARFSLMGLLKTLPLVLLLVAITGSVGWALVGSMFSDDPSPYYGPYMAVVAPIMAVFLAGQAKRYHAALTGGGAALVVEDGRLRYRGGWRASVPVDAITGAEAVSARRGLGMRRYAKVTADRELFIDLATLGESEAEVVESLKALIENPAGRPS